MTCVQKIAAIVEEACRKDTNRFGYGAWKHHILVVAKYAKLLAGKIGADGEIVEIAALLHDYAGIKDYSLYEDHHIHGAREAENILKQFDYPEERTELVKSAILNHRGSKPGQKITKEALCLADADSMAHFDSITSLLYLAFFSHKMGIDEANSWLLEKLERSWNKMSPQAKEIIVEKYNASRLLLKAALLLKP